MATSQIRFAIVEGINDNKMASMGLTTVHDNVQQLAANPKTLIQ